MTSSHRSHVLRRFAREGACWIGGALAIGLGAQLRFPLPGTDVPQTGQTLAVLLVGAFLGRWRGAAAVLSYLGLVAAEVPLLAGGAAGWSALTGATSGYLWSFVPAAFLAGAHRERTRRAAPHVSAGSRFTVDLLVLLALHGWILLGGWTVLSTRIGVSRAWRAGVVPFLIGALVKSGLAAAFFQLVPAGNRARLPETSR